jgi:hypothetical protein
MPLVKGVGSSISYFSLGQLNSLPSVVSYRNRYVSAQKCALILSSQKEKYLDRVGVASTTEREYLQGGVDLSLYSLSEEHLQLIIMLC